MSSPPSDDTSLGATFRPAVASLQELIGDTPLVRLRRVVPDGGAEVWAKLEYANPGGSVKDRTAVGLLRAGEAEGKLEAGGTVIEPTAGNTGIGLALVGRRGCWQGRREGPPSWRPAGSPGAWGKGVGWLPSYRTAANAT